ncbi:MAG: hypothetical protein VW257_05205, partial [Quisquiliibacterium sp.]
RAHPKGVERVKEQLAINAFASDKICHQVRLVKRIAIDMNCSEDSFFQLRRLADRFKGEEHLLVSHPGRHQANMQLAKRDVRRLPGRPLFDHGFKRIAMRAAVPEKFKHLDLAGCFGLLRRVDRTIVSALPWLRPQGGHCPRQATGGGGAGHGFQKTAGTLIGGVLGYWMSQR